MGSIVIIVGIIGLIAIISPPNNWDSMAYHMSRVVHWIQNQSVAHYPTSYLPQLYQSPWAEFAITQLQILSGSDHFANLVQWFSMVGSIIIISLITKEMGGNLRSQIFTSAICASIPMGILQGSSTQNDYVASFWLTCFVYLVINAKNYSKLSLNYLITLGASLGLAILTKGTAYIYTLPFLLWFFVFILKREKYRAVVIIAFLTILVNLGHYIRNINLFSTPLGLTQDLRISTFSIPLFISNLVKNSAIHLYIPFDIFSVINDFTEKGIYFLHNLMNININDPNISWGGGFRFIYLATYEDTAGNSIHFILFFISIVICFFNKKINNNKLFIYYVYVVLSSFFIFCLLLKWQPWNSRLHLPFFVLSSPIIALVTTKIYHQKVANYLVSLIILLSFIWLLANETRPIFSNSNIFNTSRINQYFKSRSLLKESYVQAAELSTSSGCTNIGLFLREDSWEYPLWVLIKQTTKTKIDIKIEHILVSNSSNYKSTVYPHKDFLPCSIIAVGVKQNSHTKLTVNATTFIKKEEYLTDNQELVSVFIPISWH